MRNLSLSLLFIIVLVTRLFSLPANTTVFLARHHPDKVIIIIRDFFLWKWLFVSQWWHWPTWVFMLRRRGRGDALRGGWGCHGGGGSLRAVTTVIHQPTLSRDAEISWLVNVTNGGLWLVSTWSRGSGWELMSLSTFLCQSSFIILVIMTSHLVTSEHGGHGAVRVPDHPILGETSEPHLPRPWVSVLWSLHKWKIRNGLVLWKYW